MTKQEITQEVKDLLQLGHNRQAVDLAISLSAEKKDAEWKTKIRELQLKIFKNWKGQNECIDYIDENLLSNQENTPQIEVKKGVGTLSNPLPVGQRSETEKSLQIGRSGSGVMDNNLPVENTPLTNPVLRKDDAVSRIDEEKSKEQNDSFNQETHYTTAPATKEDICECGHSSAEHDRFENQCQGEDWDNEKECYLFCKCKKFKRKEGKNPRIIPTGKDTLDKKEGKRK
jgi:hypothetical protein